MAARKKKAKRKPPSRRRPARKRRAPARKPAAAKSSGDLVLQVARQMAGVIERGVKRTLAKLPRRGATSAAKERLRDAVAALRRQAESLKQQAQELEARGAEAAAAVWRPLGERLDKAAGDLRRRLGR